MEVKQGLFLAAMTTLVEAANLSVRKGFKREKWLMCGNPKLEEEDAMP